MFDRENRWLDWGYSLRGCALAIIAMLWVVSVSAQESSDPNRDTTSVDPGASADFAKLEGAQREAGFEAPASDRADPLDTGTPQEPGDNRDFSIVGDYVDSAGFHDALSAAGELQALQIDNLTDLADRTPHLEIQNSFNTPNPTIFIRGVGLRDYTSNAPGPIGVYQDGINLNSPVIQFGQHFDLEAVEVLSGPQGSLYSHNAAAGAILLRSAMPDGEFGISTELSYGNYDAKRVEAAVDVPLIDDKLSMRVSGTAQWRDGYTKNQCAGWNPEALGFRRVDEMANVDLYNALQPAGQWSGGMIQPAQIERQNGTQDTADFVYLNYALALAERPNTFGITTGPLLNPWVLAEDLFDENGVQIASAGDPIARQAPALLIVDVDGICTVNPPGRVATDEAQFNAPADPIFAAGNWLPNRIQPQLEDFAGLERWTNDIDHWAARMVLLFEPFENMEWMLNAHGTRNRSDSAHLQMLGANAKLDGSGFVEWQQNGFSELIAAAISGFRLGEGSRRVPGIEPDPASPPGEGGGNPFSGFYSSDGTNRVDAWGINGHGSWDLGPVVVTLLYDYEWFDRVFEDEGDANPLRLFPAIWNDSGWQTTEELRADREGERYVVTAGFFFLYEDLDAQNHFPITELFVIDERISQTLLSWAPYLNFEIDLVEEGVIAGIHALSFSGGARYNWEKKEFSFAGSVGSAASSAQVIELREESVDETWKEWTGDVQLAYTPFSNAYGTLLSYFKYGHGYKGGHFNPIIEILAGNPSLKIDPVEPSVNDAIEIGFRSRWLGDRLIFNAALFRYWYRGLQVFEIKNEAGGLPFPQLLDSDAKVRGAEAELRVKPFPGLLLSANFGWLDAEYKKFAVKKRVLQPRGPPQLQNFDYRGNSLVAAPEWTFAGVAEFEIPLCGWGSLVPQWDVNYRSKVYLDPQQLDPISQDGYWRHNAQISYRVPGERIEVAFWIANIFEEEYKLDVFDITRESNTILEVWGEPRTYGVTLSLNW